MDLNTFTIDQLPYQTGEVLPKDCTKYEVTMGAVPDEICDVYPTPYMDVIFSSSDKNGWVFSAALPIVFA